MDAELTNALFDRYPGLFRERMSPESGLRHGLECGNGWYELIDTLCACLAQEVKASDVEPISIAQVKQKFGGLRVYVDNATDHQLGMTRLASALSERICECCGAPGRASVIGKMHVVRCETHLAEARA